MQVLKVQSQLALPIYRNYFFRTCAAQLGVMRLGLVQWTWCYYMIKTQGLTHIHLVVQDLDKSLRFYESVFGMEEQFRDGPGTVCLTD